MKRDYNAFAVMFFVIALGNLFKGFIGDMKMEYQSSAGTLVIVNPFENGLIVAADSKGTPVQMDKEEFENVIKSESARKRLLCHQKLFKVGKNLVAVYGGWNSPEKMDTL